MAALKLLLRESSRRKRLFRNLKLVRTQLRMAGWELAETPGPIVRLPLMGGREVMELKKRLLAGGIYPPFLKYSSASAEGIFRFVIANTRRRSCKS